MKKAINSYIMNLHVIAILSLSSSCYFGMGSLGPVVEEQRNVEDFYKLEVSSGIDVKLLQGSQHRVVIKASENIMDDVETEVINGKLKVSMERNWFRGGASVEAEITFVELTSIDLSAGSDLESEGNLVFDDLEIRASAGSDLKMNLEASSVNLMASSGSDATISGSAKFFEAKVSSGSDVNAYDFETANATLECSSGSDVKAFVTETLNVKASSGSDVHYRGDPNLVEVNTSSGADLIKTD